MILNLIIYIFFNFGYPRKIQFDPKLDKFEFAENNWI